VRKSDEETLLALNADYIRSVQSSDVHRFEEILGPDFYCSMPDGKLLDRAAFIELTARPVSITGLQATDVLVRHFGNIAIIHGRTEYTDSNGSAGVGRYTDVWAKQHGQWLAISAHVTRE
jgi:ketosteroid isomerase-like protein